MKSVLNKKYLLLLFLALCFDQGFAAGPPPPPGGGGDPGCWPPPCVVPIDGGISLLIAAGAALGAKKAYDLKNEKK